MGGIFGKRKTTKELVREQKRIINKSVRELARERNGLRREEAKIVAEIKRLAKLNKLKSVEILVKDLVRLRKSETKFYTMEAELRAISYQMTSMASQEVMMESMRKVTKAMKSMNSKVKMPELKSVMLEFARQNHQAEMVKELMDDAVDNALESPEDEEEEELIIDQVLDEIGVEMDKALISAPKRKNSMRLVEEEDDEKEDQNIRMSNKLRGD